MPHVYSSTIIFTECLNINQFEQLSINYCNEKIQNFCTKRLLHDEQRWLESEGIEIASIPFPGNDRVLGMKKSADSIFQFSFSHSFNIVFLLDMLEGKFGILSILDEECRMPAPKTATFVQNVISKHNDAKIFSTCMNSKKTTSCGESKCGIDFVIHHYGQKVQYTTVLKQQYLFNKCKKFKLNSIIYDILASTLVCDIFISFQDDFIDRNAEVCPKSLQNLADKVLGSLRFKYTNDILSLGSTINRASQSKTTFSTKFKADLNMLIFKLQHTVSGFYRYYI